MNVNIDQAVKVLNEICVTDQVTIQRLVENRERCGKELSLHPTVQVSAKGEEYRLGLMGVINGIFGADTSGQGYIAAMYEGDRIVEFKVIGLGDEPD